VSRLRKDGGGVRRNHTGGGVRKCFRRGVKVRLGVSQEGTLLKFTELSFPSRVGMFP
jgi:hypothetical protein